MAYKLINVNQLDSTVQGFITKLKVKDFETQANLKALAYKDFVDNINVSSSLTTLISSKLNLTDLNSLVVGDIASVFKPGGSVTFANLPAPTAGSYGYVYNVINQFTTDDRFVEGPGKTFPSGSEVAIILKEKTNQSDPDEYLFNVFSSFIDTSQFASQSEYLPFKQKLDTMEIATDSDIQAIINRL